MSNNDTEIVIYQSEDGRTKVDVRFEDETVWLTQQQLVDLFQTSKSNVSEHIKHIFEEGELEEKRVVRKFRTTASDGKSYNTNHYNLDMIISLGYRVHSHIATQFRRWSRINFIMQLMDILLRKLYMKELMQRSLLWDSPIFQVILR